MMRVDRMDGKVERLKITINFLCMVEKKNRRKGNAL